MYATLTRQRKASPPAGTRSASCVMPPPFFQATAVKEDLRMILRAVGTHKSYSRHSPSPPREHHRALNPSMRTRAHRAVSQKSAYVGAEFRSRGITILGFALYCLGDDRIQISPHPALGRG